MYFTTIYTYNDTENIIGMITIIFITEIITDIRTFHYQGQILIIKVGWTTMHVWWKLIWLHSIGQANQKAVLSIARMQSIYCCQRGLDVCPSGDFLKVHALRLNLRAFQIIYVTGFGKTCIVHTSNVSTFVTHKIYLE